MASSATQPPSSSPRLLRVWDVPTRLFHWLLVLAVVGLVITGNVGGNAMVWHFRLGYAVFALLAFRLVWGFVGGHWSRFAQFVYSPATVVRYLRGQTRPEWTVAHNPLGAASVFALLGFLALQVASGLFSDDEIAFAGPLTRFVSGQWVSRATDYHINVGNLILIALVVLHIAAIVFYKLKKGQNLVPAMLHGNKPVADAAALPASQDSVATWLRAAVLLALCAGGVAWVVSLGA